MRIDMTLDKITFSDGSILSLGENDIVVFVGPNNVGKSHTLQVIYSLLKERSQSDIVVKSINYRLGATSEELKSYVRSVSTRGLEYNRVLFSGFGYEIEDYRLDRVDAKQLEKEGLGTLRGLFANRLTTESRLELSTPPTSINLISEGAKHPVHMIQKNDVLEEKISSYFSSVFGLDLLVHRNAGKIVPIYVGKKPHTNDRDRTAYSYLLELESLQQLAAQGDGMRSFASILLNVFVSEHSVLIIDEPEAFLHPPQMRALGKIIGRDLPRGKQLFLATHSQDFIKGLIDASRENVRIVRIDRHQDTSSITHISNAELSDLWKKSFIRYSNVINGLFHTKIIVCESDSDVQFYSAILDAVFEKQNKVSPDYLFVQAGGKDRVPGIVECAQAFNKNVNVVLDIDALQGDLVERIYTLLKGQVTPELSHNLRVVRGAIRESSQPTVEEIREEIHRVLSASDDKAVFDSKLKTSLAETIKGRTSWGEFKKIGESYIPNGEATTSLRAVFQLLEQAGIFLVKVGELENFVPSVSNHGPKWLSSVFERDLKVDTELEAARLFVMGFIDSSYENLT